MRGGLDLLHAREDPRQGAQGIGPQGGNGLGLVVLFLCRFQLRMHAGHFGTQGDEFLFGAMVQSGYVLTELKGPQPNGCTKAENCGSHSPAHPALAAVGPCISSTSPVRQTAVDSAPTPNGT